MSIKLAQQTCFLQHASLPPPLFVTPPIYSFFALFVISNVILFLSFILGFWSQTVFLIPFLSPSPPFSPRPHPDHSHQRANVIFSKKFLIKIFFKTHKTQSFNFFHLFLNEIFQNPSQFYHKHFSYLFNCFIIQKNKQNFFFFFYHLFL